MRERKVVVIDYGLGNLMSVKRGLEKVGAEAHLSNNASEILSATHVVLPGVGAFGNAMAALNSYGLVRVLQDIAEMGTPLLGICLGMQLMLDESEEFGYTKGLGLMPGKVIAIPKESESGKPLKIPHIGWSALRQVGLSSWKKSLLEDIQPGASVYFVHSFMAQPIEPSVRLADCIYGGHRVAAVLRRENITGCQFHPEKSGPVGLDMLKNFIKP
jgi:glutamine amidotransferase